MSLQLEILKVDVITTTKERYEKEAAMLHVVNEAKELRGGLWFLEQLLMAIKA